MRCGNGTRRPRRQGAVPSRLVIRPLARESLIAIGDFIAEDSPAAALAFVESIRGRCDALCLFPEQGRRRDDIIPGLRLVAHERRVVIAYRIIDDAVEIIDFFYGGRDYEALLRGDG